MYIIKLSKKILAGILAGTFLLGSVSVVYADNETQKTTQLSVTMESTYTLTVPANTTITFGNENTDIGDVKVTGSMASNKIVKVSATKNNFVSGSNSFTYNLLSNGSAFTSASWTSAEVTAEKAVGLTVNIPQATWNTVQPGEYTGSIVFNVEVDNAD